LPVVTTHKFQPDHYFNTIGAHPPVLTVQPGDTIATTTVDALGFDAASNQAARRGNPQTGPFFVEGAEPGDTLVVRIEKLLPNRDTGVSASVLSENVVDPEFVRELPPANLITWLIDRDNRTATPENPIPGLESLVLPWEPMLGCFGVAAKGGQFISTATSAEHGGNMDYRGFTEGATVYFPVFEPGALFHLGDGHATQGDGEISGTGIEISMDVQVTVDLIKGKKSGWPRGENKHYIFTAGNARPLDQALQHATTEMVRWLKQDYSLDGVAASTLLGQCVEYDVGNVYDPAYTMICKMPKRILAMLNG
jgi:acetamidase/formamidase